MLASIMDLLDSTVVNIAIPSIQLHLHASSSAIQWIVAGYSLSFALLLITAGRLGGSTAQGVTLGGAGTGLPLWVVENGMATRKAGP